MPRRRWRTRERREPLSNAWQRFFATGQQFGGEDDPKDGRWGVVLVWHQFEPMWVAHREAFLEEWIVEHAGTRPWAWWKYTATEGRRVIGGASATPCVES